MKLRQHLSGYKVIPAWMVQFGLRTNPLTVRNTKPLNRSGRRGRDTLTARKNWKLTLDIKLLFQGQIISSQTLILPVPGHTVSNIIETAVTQRSGFLRMTPVQRFPLLPKGTAGTPSTVLCALQPYLKRLCSNTRKAAGGYPHPQNLRISSRQYSDSSILRWKNAYKINALGQKTAGRRVSLAFHPLYLCIQGTSTYIFRLAADYHHLGSTSRPDCCAFPYLIQTSFQLETHHLTGISRKPVTSRQSYHQRVLNQGGKYIYIYAFRTHFCKPEHCQPATNTEKNIEGLRPNTEQSGLKSDTSTQKLEQC